MFIYAWLSHQTEHNKMQGTASVSSPPNNDFKADWALKLKNDMLKSTIEEAQKAAVSNAEMLWSTECS